MGRYKKDFVLYPRPLQDGRSVWYYRTYTEDGRRTPGCSTGLTSKTLAEKHCNKLKAQGKLVPQKVIERTYMPTLREWAESEKWWQWGKCKYLHGQLSRSDVDKPAVSQRYADDALRDLLGYILPAHGSKRLNEITPADCEALLFAWEAKGLAKKSVNNKASVYRIMLGEAERLGKIERNPWDRVQSFKPADHPKGILTLEEARQLLNPEKIAVVWAGNELTYLTSLLASVTACRLGEVLGLRRRICSRITFTWRRAGNESTGSGGQRRSASTISPCRVSSPRPSCGSAHGMVTFSAIAEATSRQNRAASTMR